MKTLLTIALVAVTFSYAHGANLLIPLSIADVTGRREGSCDRGAVATSATNFGDDGGGYPHEL